MVRADTPTYAYRYEDVRQPTIQELN